MTPEELDAWKIGQAEVGREVSALVAEIERGRERETELRAAAQTFSDLFTIGTTEGGNAYIENVSGGCVRALRALREVLG